MDPAIVYTLLGILIALALYQVAVLSTVLVRLEQRIARVAHAVGASTTGSLPLSERVKAIARDPGRKIEAIKVHREETGAGLAESKTAVEAYIESLKS